MTTVIRPKPLAPGDAVGIAAPASPFDRGAFLRGVRAIGEEGYRTVFGEGIFSRDRYLAGSDRRRAEELAGLFADASVRAVFCARGGYGSQRILPLLPAAVVRGNPKILLGYSDITALHGFLQRAAGLVTLHGPLVTEIGAMDPDARRALFRRLGDASPWGELAAGLEVLAGGDAEGPLAGGSLSVFCAMLGTPYAAETAGRILFFEDRGEKPYELDRLFSSLRIAGVLAGARGLLLGRFIPPPGAGPEGEGYRDEVRRIALEAVRNYGYPVLAGFPAGHFTGSLVLPLGARVALDGARGAVTVVEPCLAA